MKRKQEIEITYTKDTNKDFNCILGVLLFSVIVCIALQLTTLQTMGNVRDTVNSNTLAINGIECAENIKEPIITTIEEHKIFHVGADSIFTRLQHFKVLHKDCVGAKLYYPSIEHSLYWG